MFSVFLFLVIFISMCLFIYEEDDSPIEFLQATETVAFRRHAFVDVFDPLDSVGIDFFTSTDAADQDVRAQEEDSPVRAETTIPEPSSSINVNEAIPTEESSDAITVSSPEALAVVGKAAPKTRKKSEQKKTPDTDAFQKTKKPRQSKAKKEEGTQNQTAA